MKKIELYIPLLSCVFAACLPACNRNNKAAEEAADSAANYQMPKNASFPGGGASFCKPSGLSRNDSVLFMEGGGRDFQLSEINETTTAKAPSGMVYIPGGDFSMGGVNPVGMNDGGHQHMDDARPVHRVEISPFFMDANEVTNKEFSEFIKATGYVTIAEMKPTKEEFPDAPEENLVAGSLVFNPPKDKIPLDNFLRWWSYEKGADWRHPQGEGSNIEGKDNYPVVQVAWDDAVAYAKWAGKRLPTEAEWEFAARAGRSGELYTWGNKFRPEGKFMANIFEGSFPDNDTGVDGYKGIAPVKRYPANDYGLFDIAGNVWEWCNDWYRSDYYADQSKNKLNVNPKGPSESLDEEEPGVKKKVQRGGSFLCTDQYCTRYMVGTRGKGEYRSASNHIGFRCVKDVAPADRKLVLNR